MGWLEEAEGCGWRYHPRRRGRQIPPRVFNPNFPLNRIFPSGILSTLIFSTLAGVAGLQLTMRIAYTG
ncbi:hypothetical protein BDV59DRAFT_177509 [Aspergillus ambiguus]|uniref:uncharacterized protein n=1 Tax=Aspergillus ambiguus TaxID=176160 RepID=UPI003CCD0EC9